MVLAEIERRTGRPIARLFSLIAGCSSGSIITLGLARPRQDRVPYHPASSLVRLFEREGRTIFSRPVLHDIISAHGLLGPRYPSGGLAKVLGGLFGDDLLRDVVADVMIPCYDIQQRRLVHLTNRDAIYRDFPLRKIAGASSAAPLYFPPVRLTEAPPPRVLVDAGAFIASPAMSAYAFARETYPEDTHILLVSLGVGRTADPFPYPAAKWWGMLDWVGPLQEIVPDGSTDAVDLQLRMLFAAARAGEGRRYFRLQHPLRRRHFRLDDTRPRHIAELKAIGAQWIEEQAETLDELCGLLRENAG